MPLNNLRDLSLRVNDERIAVGFRMRVYGMACMTMLPDTFSIDVFNLPTGDLSLVRRYGKLSISGEGSVICSGEVQDIYAHKEDGSDVTTFILADGQEIWNERVSVALGAGSGVRPVLNAILGMDRLGSFLADDIRLPRGQTFDGGLADIITVLARTVRSRAYISRGLVHFAVPGKAAEAIRLTDGDLVSDPEYAEDICNVYTRVRGYPIGAMADLNGRIYRIVAQTVNADTSKGPWQSELTLVNEEVLKRDGMEGG